MSKLNLPLLFLLLVLWLVGGSWFFNKSYSTTSADEASECSFPFSISDGNFSTNSKKIFFFDKSDWEPNIPIQTLASLKTIALYLSNNDKKKLLLHGNYQPDESNDSDFKNIGHARAEALKKELIDYGAPSKRIKVSSSESEDMNLACGKIYGGVDFSFVSAQATTKEEDKSETIVAAEPVDKEETKNEETTSSDSPDYSKYSTIYYKSNQFVPKVDKDLKNWFKYLKRYLKDHPKAKLLLVGHTDKASSSDKAQRLGKYRARKLRDELVKSGIKKKRIIIESKGTEEPLGSNKTSEGRMKNRRVVVSIIN